MNQTLFLNENSLPVGAQCIDSTNAIERHNTFLSFARIEKINVLPLVIRIIKRIISTAIKYIITTKDNIKSRFINKGAPNTGPPGTWR